MDRASERVHRIVPMSWASFCWVLSWLFLLRGLFFLSAYPPLEGFDEHQHIAYIVHLNQTGELPRYGEAAIPKALYPDLVMNPHSTCGWEQLHLIGAQRYKDFWSGGHVEPDYSVDVKLCSAFHPPLYYRLLSPLYIALSDSCGFRGAVYGVRVVSILFAALSIFFFVYPLSPLYGAEHLSKLGALCVSLVPMYLVYSARVSPDGLALLITSMVFFLLAQIGTSQRTHLFMRALMIGALLGAGTFVRASLILWLPVALLFLLLLIITHRERWGGLLIACLIMVVAYAALTWSYFLYNMEVYGQPVPSQEGLKMLALGKGFPDLIRAIKIFDAWSFCLVRMVKLNLWTSGWMFRGPHEAFFQVYFWCVLFCLLGCVPWTIRRMACGACAKPPSSQLVTLCVLAVGATLLGAYIHALSSRIAYGKMMTPSYYMMPAFIPFLALALKLGQQWPGRRTWTLCASLLCVVFVVTEVHSLFFVAAPQWAQTRDLGLAMRRLSTIHPFFPSPTWMPALAVGMGILLLLIIASIRMSSSRALEESVKKDSFPA